MPAVGLSSNGTRGTFNGWTLAAVGLILRLGVAPSSVSRLGSGSSTAGRFISGPTAGAGACGGNVGTILAAYRPLVRSGLEAISLSISDMVLATKRME